MPFSCCKEQMFPYLFLVKKYCQFGSIIFASDINQNIFLSRIFMCSHIYEYINDNGHIFKRHDKYCIYVYV